MVSIWGLDRIPGAKGIPPSQASLLAGPSRNSPMLHETGCRAWGEGGSRDADKPPVATPASACDQQKGGGRVYRFAAIAQHAYTSLHCAYMCGLLHIERIECREGWEGMDHSIQCSCIAWHATPATCACRMAGFVLCACAYTHPDTCMWRREGDPESNCISPRIPAYDSRRQDI